MERGRGSGGRDWQDGFVWRIFLVEVCYLSMNMYSLHYVALHMLMFAAIVEHDVTSSHANPLLSCVDTVAEWRRLCMWLGPVYACEC